MTATPAPSFASAERLGSMVIFGWENESSRHCESAGT